MTATGQQSAARPLVVCVGDDANRRAILEHSFGGELEVVTVADAARALALLDTRDAAVLLADIEMTGGSEELLRSARERSTGTTRVVVAGQGDADRALRMLDEGLAARCIVKSRERGELVAVVRWGCETWQHVGELRRCLHDLRTPLTTILANAEHLEALAQRAPELRAAIEHAAMATEHRQLLLLILDDLLPIAEDLAGTTNDLEQLMERLRSWPDVIASRLLRS